MSKFSASDAAFEGFRLARHHPRAVLIWAGASFLTTIAVGVLTAVLLSGSLARAGGDVDPANATLTLELMRDALISLLLGLAIISVYLNGVYRAVLRSDDFHEDRWGYLRVGREELRTAGAVVLYGLIFVGLTFVVSLGASIVYSLATLTGPALGLMAVLIGLGVFFIFIFCWVRLTLALPMTFDRGRMSFRDSWRLTRGWFWPLLGMKVLTFAITAVVILTIFIIALAVAAIASGGNLREMLQGFNDNTPTLASYLNPLSLTWLLLSAAVGALQNALLYGPSAHAYRVIWAVTEEREAAKAES
ncbi:hypothetical protein P7B02_13230 [Caulobacter segnis]|uniref:hypothetical protein n=1 Tax=Caulobacter segnis TaxID=88688 RepID=UPI00240EF3C4|nr:hypothetical protein [Caulobacter segnis]MDG2522508.1 hypothetical protein [Caulobacter segnis]